MSRFPKSIFVLFFSSFCAVLLQASISIEELIRERQFSQFSLSPDGNKLAFVGPVQEGFKNIFVINLETMESKLITGEEANISGYVWANNDRIVYSIDGENRVFNGVYGIDSNGENGTVLIEPVMQSTGSAFSGISVYQRILSTYKDDDEHMLIYDTSRNRRYPDVALLNVNNGRQRTFFNNRDDLNGFTMDNDYVARFGYKFEEDGTFEIYYRESEEDAFEHLHTFNSDYIDYSIEGFTEENDAAYVTTDHLANTIGLYKLDLETMAYEKIYDDPTYDLGESTNILFSPKTGSLLGLKYEAEKPRTVLFNEQFKQLKALVDQSFPETVNLLSDWDENFNKFIITSFSDKQPPVYRLLTINPLQVIDLQKSKPWINPADIPETKPISFKARDGREIHGYLILPEEYKEGNPVPLLVLPHGGPWARDIWGFRSYLDTLQIFPATRGWAVLQVNFRGSTGYGKDHLTSSYKNINEMHYDVEDGVKWAIEAGYADPEHLGIMGASWGGYATMYGITKYPDMYRFGVNIFGVVDVIKQINWYRLRTKWGGSRDSGYEVWRRRIGDPEVPEEAAVLASASPINDIDKIKADLLIYHGTEDVNVDIAQSRMLRSKLNSENIDFEWISKADEHHSIRNFDNRLELYEKIEALLKKHGN